MFARMKKVQLPDVAEAAGVTTMTVSRYFSDPNLVSLRTRDAIEAAIDRLGYVRDGFATSMAGRSAPILVAIVPTLEHPYAAQVFRGVSDVAREADAALMVFETMFDAARQDAVIASALSWRPTGIVHLGGALSESARRKVDASGCRFVEAWELPDTPVDVAIGVPNRRLARDLTSALLRAGYGRVAFALRRSGHRVEDERIAGYREAMADAGITPDVLEVPADISSLEAGARLLRQAMVLRPRPDAVLFAGDLLAAGAILSSGDAKVRVPHEVAVAGMGGYDIGAHLRPALTTASIPSRAIGEAAARLALETRQGEVRREMAFELMERSSARLA